MLCPASDNKTAVGVITAIKEPDRYGRRTETASFVYAHIALELVGMQPGDVPVTYADNTGLERDYGFTPKVGIREGLRKFAERYKMYYG